ncbi:MAG: prephenate dehydrogenase/arogenate dehydrogenase family protein [Gammaproteobacteria bacterium]
MTEFGSVAIVGLGLIGGSIAAGLKQRGLATVSAWDKDPASLEAGLQASVIDSALNSAAAAAEADVLILCVPVQSVAEVLTEIPTSDQLITDVGSVKAALIASVREARGEVPGNFVPGHPIAGSEKHGVTAANPDLFEQHRVLLTPLAETEPAAVQTVRLLWQALGAEVTEMSPQHHDAVLAQTSHLPHLAAYALVDVLCQGGDSLEVFQYAAGGFRDFSRIAASDPTMWRDVFLTNQEPVLATLDQYIAELGALRDLVAAGDGDQLKAIFERAKAARDHFADLDEARRNG